MMQQSMLSPKDRSTMTRTMSPNMRTPQKPEAPKKSLNQFSAMRTQKFIPSELNEESDDPECLLRIKTPGERSPGDKRLWLNSLMNSDAFSRVLEFLHPKDRLNCMALSKIWNNTMSNKYLMEESVHIDPIVESDRTHVFYVAPRTFSAILDLMLSNTPRFEIPSKDTKPKPVIEFDPLTRFHDMVAKYKDPATRDTKTPKTPRRSRSPTKGDSDEMMDTAAATKAEVQPDESMQTAQPATCNNTLLSLHLTRVIIDYNAIVQLSTFNNLKELSLDECKIRTGGVFYDCPQCKKSMKIASMINCDRCRRVYYCSNECRNKHLYLHCMECIIGPVHSNHGSDGHHHSKPHSNNTQKNLHNISWVERSKSLDTSSLRKLLQLCGRNLENLELNVNIGDYPKGLFQFTPYLTFVSIQDRHRALDGNIFKELAKSCPLLKEIDITHVNEMDTFVPIEVDLFTLRALAACMHLRYLGYITFSVNNIQSCLMHLDNRRNFPNLKSISFLVTEGGLEELKTFIKKSKRPNKSNASSGNVKNNSISKTLAVPRSTVIMPKSNNLAINKLDIAATTSSTSSLKSTTAVGTPTTPTTAPTSTSTKSTSIVSDSMNTVAEEKGAKEDNTSETSDNNTSNNKTNTTDSSNSGKSTERVELSVDNQTTVHGKRKKKLSPLTRLKVAMECLSDDKIAFFANATNKVGVVFTDSHSNIVSLNFGFYKMFGYRLKMHQGISLWSLLSGALTNKDMANQIRSMVTDRNVFETTLKAYCIDNSCLDVLISIVPLKRSLYFHAVDNSAVSHAHDSVILAGDRSDEESLIAANTLIRIEIVDKKIKLKKSFLDDGIIASIAKSLERPIEIRGGFVNLSKLVQLFSSMSSVIALAQHILSNNTDPYVITDQKGRILFGNKAWQHICQYSNEQVWGKTCGILQGPLTNFEGIQAMNEKLLSGLSGEALTTNYRGDGNSFFTQVLVIPNIVTISNQDDLTWLRNNAFPEVSSDVEFEIVPSIHLCRLSPWSEPWKTNDNNSSTSNSFYGTADLATAMKCLESADDMKQKINTVLNWFCDQKTNSDSMNSTFQQMQLSPNNKHQRSIPMSMSPTMSMTAPTTPRNTKKSVFSNRRHSTVKTQNNNDFDEHLIDEIKWNHSDNNNNSNNNNNAHVVDNRARNVFHSLCSWIDFSPNVAYFITANNGEILYGNKPWMEYVGYELKEVIGKSWDMLKGPLTNADKSLSSLENLIRCGHTGEARVVYYRKDGKAVYTLVSIMACIGPERLHLCRFVPLSESFIPYMENESSKSKDSSRQQTPFLTSLNTSSSNKQLLLSNPINSMVAVNDNKRNVSIFEGVVYFITVVQTNNGSSSMQTNSNASNDSETIVQLSSETLAMKEIQNLGMAHSIRIIVSNLIE